MGENLFFFFFGLRLTRPMTPRARWGGKERAGAGAGLGRGKLGGREKERAGESPERECG